MTPPLELLPAEPHGGLGSSGDGRAVEAPTSAERVTALYEAEFEFVWRSLRRLGVPPAMLDDAVQDVFVVVHRRLDEFEGRSSVRTWVFSIALNVAQHYRRALARHRTAELPAEVSDGLPDPHDRAAHAEAARLVYALLDGLDEGRRAVFVLSELEQLPAPEIAEALGIPLNTVYSRLRLARRDFDAALARHEAKARREKP